MPKILNILHTNYTKRLISLFLFIAAFLFMQDAVAQTYPVQTNVYVSPPYGKHLSDYYSTTKERLVVSLLNRDNLKPVLEVRLKMTITASNGLKIQSKEEVNYPTITLDAGIPTRLTQDDLSPYFLNINSQGYFDRGKLPDGQVEFTFQVIEKYTGKVLSAPATGRVWLSSQKPPLLRLPSNDESVAFRDPMNMKFQWEPQHKNLSQVEYEFELRELPDYAGAPQSIFMYAPVIHQERLLYTSLIYDAMLPPLDPNKTYGWRVRAIAKDGIDELNMFENNGYSEIRWFRTQNDCPAPSGVKAILEGRRIDLTWTPGMGNVDYLVQYRPKYGTSEQWSELNAYDNRASIYDAARGMTYEYRVGGICMAVGQPVFSPVGEIMVPAVDSTRLRNCGIMAPIDFTNKELLPELKVGDRVMLSDYPMTITQVTGANGVFSGEGWVPVNWLLETKWAVEFTSITINTDYRMIRGSVKSQYDETLSQIADGDKILGGGTESTLDGIIRADVDIDFIIPENPQFEYNEEKGEIIVYTTDNQNPVGTIVLPKNQGEGDVFPMTVKDKDGKIYKLEEETDEEGNTKITATQVGESGDPISLDDAAKQNISTDIAVVTFEQGDGQYAFDKGDIRYQQIAKIKKEYEILAGGKDGYLVPWKFLPLGGSDKVQAKVAVNEAKKKDEANPFDISKVVFATPQGTRYTAKYDDKTKAFTIDLVAGNSDDVQEIYALYKESSQSYKTLGKLKVITYQRQVNKLVVVQIDGNTIVKGELEEYLKKVYSPVGVSWEVSVEDYNYTGNTKGFFEKGSGLLSAYNGNMKALQDAYKKHKGGSFDKNTAYVFIMGESGRKNDRDTQGFMPKGKQFGYIFKKDIGSKGNIYQIISHELGHGRWQMAHTFDGTYGNIIKEGKSDPHNLMDYTSDGIHLAKWQWNIMNNPALLSNPFESDEKAMSHRVKNLSAFLDWIKENKGNKEISYNKNLFYDGTVISDFAVVENDIKLYIEFYDSGVINLGKNDKNKYPWLKIDFELGNTFHNGFYFSIPYSNSDNIAIKIWFYSYNDFCKFLDYIGLEITEESKKIVVELYKGAITKAGDDCNKLDVIYETIPDFVISELSDGTLIHHLKLLSECQMSNTTMSILFGSGIDTDEEIAALTILKNIEDKHALYENFYNSPETVLNLYKKIGGDNGKILSQLFTTIATEYWSDKEDLLNEAYNEINIAASLVGNKRNIFYILSNHEVHGKIDGDKIKLHGNNFYGNPVQVRHIPEQTSFNPFDPTFLIFTAGGNVNEYKNLCIPAISLLHIADEKLWEKEKDGAMGALQLFGVYAAAYTYVNSTSKLLRTVAVLEIGNEATRMFMNNENVRLYFENQSWGTDFLTGYTAISTGVDILSISTGIITALRTHADDVRHVIKSNNFTADELAEYDRVVTVIKNAGKADEIIDIAKAEQRYAKTYASVSSKPYGLQMTLDEVEAAFGTNGRKIVEETQRKAKEIVKQTGGNKQGDPVLTGLIDNKTGKIFFGRNLKSQREIDIFLEDLHPILKKRLEIHQSHITNNTLNASAVDIQRAGTPASHSEIVAMDEALKARGANVTEADLNDFIIHNKRLGGEVDNLGVPKGCPPRCAHCWFLSDEIKVIGND